MVADQRGRRPSLGKGMAIRQCSCSRVVATAAATTRRFGLGRTLAVGGALLIAACAGPSGSGPPQVSPSSASTEAISPAPFIKSFGTAWNPVPDVTITLTVAAVPASATGPVDSTGHPSVIPAH